MWLEAEKMAKIAVVTIAFLVPPTVHAAGTAFIEEGGVVGIARNEGEAHAKVVATFFVPAGGASTRIDAAESGGRNCPF